MKNVLIIGGNGMLGRTLQHILTDCNIFIADLPYADITDYDNINKFISNNIDVVIHCAALTNVEQCEQNKDKTFIVNYFGTVNVALSCKLNSVKLVYISTDYVFDGTLNRPYNESDKPTGGLNIYGKSKWMGELAVQNISNDYLICRVSWLYGPGGPSFIHKMVNLSKNNNTIYVINDQFGNPTSTNAVAIKLNEIIKRNISNEIFHLTCEGEISWYDYACTIFKLLNIKRDVIPCDSTQFKTLAIRPNNSCLEKQNLIKYNFSKMPDWYEELKTFINLEFKSI